MELFPTLGRICIVIPILELAKAAEMPCFQ
jgi:hypothetical protein